MTADAASNTGSDLVVLRYSSREVNGQVEHHKGGQLHFL